MAEIGKPVTIMGANASGKTALALAIAARTGGEVISADSKQVYRRLEAGTSKPRGEWAERGGRRLYLVSGIPYHLVDLIDPKASYDVSSFVEAARAARAEAEEAGALPVFAGGTGMYIQAYWNGLDPLPKGDTAMRSELEKFAELHGRAALHAQLAELDPAAAAQIPPNNIQRVIRAIEICRLACRPVSELWTGRFFDSLPEKEGTFVFIRWKKELLAERIKRRTSEAFDAWAAETSALLKEGYPEDCPGLKSLGYPQVLDFLAGKLDRHEAVRSITAVSLAYAKRQNTWFERYKNALRIEIKCAEDYDAGKLADHVLEKCRKPS